MRILEINDRILVLLRKDMLLLELCVCLLMWNDTYYLETQQSRSNVDGYALHEGSNRGSQKRISQKFVTTLGQKAKEEKHVHSLGLPIRSWLKRIYLYVTNSGTVRCDVSRNFAQPSWFGTVHVPLEFDEYTGWLKNDNIVFFIVVMFLYIFYFILILEL